MNHPHKLSKLCKDCLKGEENIEHYNCNFIISLCNRIVLLSQLLIARPQHFGKEIIDLQVALSEIDEQIKTISPNSLSLKSTDFLNRKGKLAQELQIRIRLVAMLETL